MKLTDTIPRLPLGFRRHSQVMEEGAEAPNFIVVRAGWAAKFDLLPDGRRQIFDLLLPGDFASCDELVSEQARSSVVALSDVETCQFPRQTTLRAVTSSSEAFIAFTRLCAEYPDRMREMLVAIGRQTAESRIARLILSIRQRLSRPEQGPLNVIPFPLRQQDIADILGLTQVHVSRVLKTLRDRRIVEFGDGELRLNNVAELTQISNR